MLDVRGYTLSLPRGGFGGVPEHFFAGAVGEIQYLSMKEGAVGESDAST